MNPSQLLSLLRLGMVSLSLTGGTTRPHLTFIHWVLMEQLSSLAFVGTNAYWLPVLNTEEDINFTLGNMTKAGITVVRTWAFNGQSLASLSNLIVQLAI